MRILGKEFKLEFVDGSVFTPDNMGMMEFKNQRISIIGGMPNDNTQETILHEIIHIVDESFSLELGEKKVNALSSALYSIFKDNGIKIEFKQHK